MKRNFFVACAVVLACCAGCKKDDSATQVQSKDYFPVSVGIEFTYNYSQSEYPAGGFSTDVWDGTQSWKVIGISSDADKHYYHFRNIRHFVHTAVTYVPIITHSQTEITDTLFFTISETVKDGLLSGFPYQEGLKISRYGHDSTDNLIVNGDGLTYTFRADKGLVELKMDRVGNSARHFMLALL